MRLLYRYLQGPSGPTGPNTVTTTTTTDLTGVLTGDGENVGVTLTTTGGNGSLDGGKLLLLNGNGGISAVAGISSEANTVGSKAFTGIANQDDSLTYVFQFYTATFDQFSLRGDASWLVGTTVATNFLAALAASYKSTPVDADEVIIRDSAASNAPKKVTLTNLWAWIQSKIDSTATPVAVSALPAAGTAGRRRFVSDANATTFASIVAGGGANVVPVYDDGTNWRIG